MPRIIHIKNGFKITTSLAGDGWVEPEDGSQILEGDPRLNSMEWASKPPSPPIWPDVEAFMAAFTLEEMAAISLSVDPITAGLRLQLASWRSPVDPSHALVQTGLNQLVTTGIISEARKADIIATATEN